MYSGLLLICIDLLLEQCWFAGNGRQTKVLSLSTSEGNYNQQGDLVAV